MASISTTFCFVFTECFDPPYRFGHFFFPKQVIGDQNMEGKDRISLSSFQVHKVIQIVSVFYVPIVGNKEGNFKRGKYSREDSMNL